MKSTIKDNKQFSVSLKGIRGTGRKLKREANNVVLYGMEHYLLHRDTHFLFRAYKACVGEAKLDTKQMLSFITKHCNVKLENEGTKNAKFVMNGKGAKYTEPTVAWFDYEREVKPSDGMKDAEKWLANAIKNMAKTLADNKYSDAPEAKQIFKQLSAIRVS